VNNIIDRLRVRRSWRQLLLGEAVTWLLWRQRASDVLCLVRCGAWLTSTCRLSVRRQGVMVWAAGVGATRLLLGGRHVLRHVRYLPHWTTR